MKILKTITIAGQSIQVVYKENLQVEGQDVWGYYDSDKHEIGLRKGMEKTREMEILLHEGIHAIESIHTLKLSEKAIKILGIEILAFIRNNKLNLLERRAPAK